MFSRKLNHPTLSSVDESQVQLPPTRYSVEKNGVRRLAFEKSVIFPAVSKSPAKPAASRASNFKGNHALVPNFAIDSLVIIKKQASEQ